MYFRRRQVGAIVFGMFSSNKASRSGLKKRGNLKDVAYSASSLW